MSVEIAASAGDTCVALPFSPEYIQQLEARRHTIPYGRTAAGLILYVDIHLPDRTCLSGQPQLPVLVSYHGGGLINGSRRDPMFPEVTAAVLAAGNIIVYPDYRLLKPSSCWNQLEDVEAFLQYMSSEKFNKDLSNLSGCPVVVDKERIAITGFSAGSYLARLAIVAAIKQQSQGELDFVFIRAALFFGMGGDMLLDYWIISRISPQTPPPKAIIPEEELADSPYTPTLPGYGASIARSEWCAWLWDTALFPDLCFDEPGFAARLSNLATSDERELALVAEGKAEATNGKLKRRHTYEDVIPQIFLRASSLAMKWPSTLFVHGSDDPIVPIEETMRSLEQLKGKGCQPEIFVVRRGEHGLLDFESGLEASDRALAIAKAAAFLNHALA